MRTPVPAVLVLEQHLVQVEAGRVVEHERLGAPPLTEAIGRHLVAIAAGLAVAGEDQTHRVTRVRGLEQRPAILVDDVVRWRRDRPNVGGCRIGVRLARRVADPAKGKELGHRTVRFRRGNPIVAYRPVAATEGHAWSRPLTTHSRKAVACSPARARMQPSSPSSERATSSPTRGRFARPWVGPTSVPGGSTLPGPSSSVPSRSTRSTT